MADPALVICNDRGRVALLARAEELLPEGEALVLVRDIVSRRRTCRTVPESRRAQLIATEIPMILRAGLTWLVSYYRVPIDELAAREDHYEGGALSHSYDVTLRVACRGHAPRSQAAG